jgi:hypothetical protein
VTAVSLVPITSSSLVYGTSDAGKTFAFDPLVDTALEKLGRSLNLKSHIFRDMKTRTPREIFTCADLEIHKGLDGRYYAIDTARIMPPTAFTHGLQGEHLFNQFSLNSCVCTQKRFVQMLSLDLPLKVHKNTTKRLDRLQSIWSMFSARSWQKLCLNEENHQKMSHHPLHLYFTVWVLICDTLELSFII